TPRCMTTAPGSPPPISSLPASTFQISRPRWQPNSQQGPVFAPHPTAKAGPERITMSEAAVISAVYTEWKMVKTRSALVLCFEVPLEQQATVQAALGTPLPDQSIHVAIARLREGAAPQ